MISENISIEDLNAMAPNTLLQSLSIEFTEIGSDYLIAKMPVNSTTHQPMGLLHGGASVALAETVGSVGTNCLIDVQTHAAVGLEINANHVGSARDGYVYGKGTLIHKGRSTHIWNIDITDEEGKKISICRLTMMVIYKKK